MRNAELWEESLDSICIECLRQLYTHNIIFSSFLNLFELIVTFIKEDVQVYIFNSFKIIILLIF